MSASELVLAVVLLTTPPGVPDDPPEPDRWPALQQALQDVAVRWEVLDPRETGYILAKRDDFGTDVNLLRRRLAEYRDAPLVVDGFRLPDKAVAADRLKFNRAFRDHLEAREQIETDRAADLREAIREAERLYQIWDAVRDARCDHYHVTVRRQALKKLRCLLGEEAYRAGDLPPAVPLWRFAEAK